MTYELKTEKFSGPLEKLLELIEAKQLEITELNLAEVTADFLNYLRELEKLSTVEPRLIADFVVVAARLLLIKSKALLPSLEITEEEKVEIKDLEERLRLYKEFKAASQHLQRQWNDQAVVFSREFLSFAQPIFYPPPDLTVDKLQQALARLLADLSQFVLESKNIKVAIISLEEKMAELMERVKISALKFKELVKEKSRAEIIALFLAVLHLLKNEIIKVDQKEQFSEIEISGV